jgi:5'-3' exonuclease
MAVSDGLPSDTQLDLKRIASIGEDCAQGLILASHRAVELSERITQLQQLIPAFDKISASATAEFAKAANEISKVHAETARKAASENEKLISQIIKLSDQHEETQNIAKSANDQFTKTFANSVDTIDSILNRYEAIIASQRSESRIWFGLILLAIVIVGVLSAHVQI